MKAKILIVDDEKLICWSLEKDLTKLDYHVVTVQTAAAGKKIFSEELFDLVLLDIRLPDGNGKELLTYMRQTIPLISVIMITANDDIKTAVECMQLGAFTYLHKPFDFEELVLNIEKALEQGKLRQKVSAWEYQERGKYDFRNIVAESKPMKAILTVLPQISQSDASTILLQGESGTGKDLVAKTIHYASKRAERSFVSINCAAIPATLIESELFGHEKGAFTDARQMKKGLVEEANGGTLFLDEIGDMTKELQAKLLHLIDQKKYRKVGGLKELTAEIRIIAATNKDLKAEVASGRFREDLYYRLHVIPVYLPPLRERKEDIPNLVSFFIAHFNLEFKKSITEISQEALDIVMNYDWPGNVRELKNVIERAIILNHDSVIRSEHLPQEINCDCSLKDSTRTEEKSNSTKLPGCLKGVALESIEKYAILLALETTDGNQSHAAKLLGIGRDALRYKMQKFNLFQAEENPAPR